MLRSERSAIIDETLTSETRQNREGMASFDKLQPSKTALIYIEFQNEFATEGGKLYPAMQPCLEGVNTLSNARKVLETFRAKEYTIIHAPISFSDDYRELSNNAYGILKNVKDGGCFLGWGAAFRDEFQPRDKEIVISGKRGLCAFASTNLDFILRQKGIETIVLGGFLTNCCVESTMRTAYEKGFQVITLTDCACASSLEEHVSIIYPYENPFIHRRACRKPL